MSYVSIKPMCSIVAGVALLVSASGCATKPADPSRLAASAATSMQSADLVRVPNIEGLGATVAESVIRSAGLVPSDVPIHGPIDADAADIALAYRQSPRPGSMVPRGSKVSFRWWWEAG